MTTAIDTDVDEFLSQTLVAVISWTDGDGAPRSAPIWHSWEGGAAYMFTGRQTLKWRCLSRDPRASLCVDWREPPYKSVILSGRVEEVERPLYDLVLSMALRYYGEEEGRAFAEGYRDGSEDVVVFRLTPTRAASFL